MSIDQIAENTENPEMVAQNKAPRLVPLYKLVRLALANKNETQIAAEAGVSQSTINLLKNRRRSTISRRKVPGLARALHVPQRDLLPFVNTK